MFYHDRQGIISEGTLDLAVGCTDFSFTDVQSVHEPIEYFENQYKNYSDVLPYEVVTLFIER